MPHAARAPDTRQTRIMPVADSILWTPAVGGPQRPAPLLFFAQHTLRKIHDRLAGVPNGLGMGLLVGRYYTCSRSGAQFVIVEGALPLPVLAAEDEPIDALADGMRKVAPGIDILGWYRGHSFSEAALTPADVEAQSELFGDRPCIVAVVSAGGEAGGIFRHSSSPAWPVESLPFYEWLGDSPAVRPEGPKPTVLNWRNYRSSETVTRQVAPAAAAAMADRISHPVLMPGADLDDEPAPVATVTNAPWLRPMLRPAIYIACALAGAVIVTAAFAFLSSDSGAPGGSRSGANSPAAAGAPAAAVALLDRRADTLALALTAWNERVRMFDARQMTCGGLSRGLQQVEDGWLGYNIARRETLTPFDSTREVRDRTLYSDVRGVERRFERSGCTRP